jgi:surface carbohydrate biosynthesis protein
LFINAPKKWALPSKADILFFDASGFEILEPYLKHYTVAVLPTDGEYINIACLFQAVLKLNFWKGAVFDVYTEQYINRVDPKIILTFIDNNPKFYELHINFPLCKTIFLQNGTRANAFDVFDVLNLSKPYRVDYMCVHNLHIGRQYQKYITGNLVALGSIKNNATLTPTDSVTTDVVFVSQWRKHPSENAPIVRSVDGTPVYWKDFYSAEITILEFLDKWCSDNSRTLTICGITDEANGYEQQFYAEHLKKCNWRYAARRAPCSSYQLVDAAAIVVFIDSTLGYEAIGRRKKVACFSCRMTNDERLGFKFGWPGNFPNQGPFWTNYSEAREFQRIMDYLTQVSDTEFAKMLECYAEDLMVYDPGNKQFIALIDQVLHDSTNELIC